MGTWDLRKTPEFDENPRGKQWSVVQNAVNSQANENEWAVYLILRTV